MLFRSWKDFDIAENLFTYASYENDFIQNSDYNNTNDWSLTEVGTGTDALSDDADFGELILTTTATDNDYEQTQFTASGGAGEWVSLASNKRLFFEARVLLEDADVGDAFVGLCITDADIHDSGSGVPEASDYIGFAKDDGDAYWDFVSAMNSTETESTAVDTAADDTYATLGFSIDGTSEVHCWIDGVKGPPISTNLPTDEQLCITFIVQTGTTSTQYMKIDYVRVYRER